MRVMMDPNENPAGRPTNGADGRSMQRLQFELALDLGSGGNRPVKETLARAAETAGADLLFVLPAARGPGMTAVVRLTDEGSDLFLQVGIAESGFAISDEAQMNQVLLGLARASVDVLQRISADRAIREPLAASN